MPIAVLTVFPSLQEKSSVSVRLFPEEKVEGINKNDSGINLVFQICNFYGKIWVGGIAMGS